jgi:hypothetical protein
VTSLDEISDDEMPLAVMKKRNEKAASEKRSASRVANRLADRAAAAVRNGGSNFIPHKQVVVLPDCVEQNVVCEKCKAIGVDTNGDDLLPCKCCEIAACSKCFPKLRSDSVEKGSRAWRSHYLQKSVDGGAIRAGQVCPGNLLQSCAPLPTRVFTDTCPCPPTCITLNAHLTRARVCVL